MDYKQLLELILVNLDEGIIVTDTNANITFYNEPVNSLTGVNSQNVIGKNLLEVFPYLSVESSTFYYVLKNKKPLIEHIQHYRNNQGKDVSILTSTMPIIENGKLLGAFEIFKDLTQVMELSDKIVSLQEQFLRKNQNNKTSYENGTKYTFNDIIGRSIPIRELKEKAYKIAYSNSPVLVYGETGTGKELLVQAIHNASSIRRQKPFIAQNCAALPHNLLESILFGTSVGGFTGALEKAGLFELANGGTLFLDEINSMDVELQAKLLRVIQDGVIRRVGGIKTKDVNVRIIASTNEDPIKLVERKLLRQDLFFRLNVISFTIPPLRERKEDIEPLVSHFIALHNEKLNKQVNGVSTDVMDLFIKYSWPGNVRELEHVIERTMNFTDKNIITVEDLQLDLSKELLTTVENSKDIDYEPFQINLYESVDKYEKGLIENAVQMTNGNYSKAARALGIPKQTLHNKVKKYNIQWEVTIKS